MKVTIDLTPGAVKDLLSQLPKQFDEKEMHTIKNVMYKAAQDSEIVSKNEDTPEDQRDRAKSNAEIYWKLFEKM